MAVIEINDTTLVQVLDGEGFCYSENEIGYFYGADAGAAETAGQITLSPRSQINGTSGQIIWAKCIGYKDALVISTPA